MTDRQDLYKNPYGGISRVIGNTIAIIVSATFVIFVFFPPEYGRVTNLPSVFQVWAFVLSTVCFAAVVVWVSVFVIRSDRSATKLRYWLRRGVAALPIPLVLVIVLALDLLGFSEAVQAIASMVYVVVLLAFILAAPVPHWLQWRRGNRLVELRRLTKNRDDHELET